MRESEIFDRINTMSTEEERLYAGASDGRGLSLDERQRLKEIQVELDRCYDLLHQRQARRAAGEDPDVAEFRAADVVEHYQQ